MLKKLMNITNDMQNIAEIKSIVPHSFVYVFFAFGLLIIVISFLTIFILQKCTKLTSQIRQMAIHMAIGNLIYGMSLFCSGMYYFIYGSLCSSLLKLLPLGSVTFNIFLTAAGADRLLSLTHSIKYTLWSKEQKSYIFIVVVYLIGICINLPNMPPNMQFTCSGEADMFSLNGLVTFVCSMLVMFACDIFIYSYIGIIAMKVQYLPRNCGGAFGAQKDNRNVWLSTVKSFALLVVTIFLLGPFVANRTIDLLNFVDGNANISQGTMISGKLLALLQIVSPVYILVSYKECRYHIAVLCCVFCEKKRDKIERCYKQHYATYTISRSGH